MTDLLVVGDSHGNYSFMVEAIDLAAELQVHALVQVGDFGFWPANGRTKTYAKRVHEYAKKSAVMLWVIDGNHDFPDEYAKYSFPSYFDRAGIYHLKRGATLRLANRSIGFLGGAVSIDQNHQIVGKSWWPEEILTEQDVRTAVDAGHDLDVMISHDAPIPPGHSIGWFGDRVQAAQLQHNPRFNKVLETWRPKVHVHGHWHHRYSCSTPWGMRYGLGHESVSSAIAILNLEDLTLR